MALHPPTHLVVVTCFVAPISAEFLTFHLGLFPVYVELSPYFFPTQYRLQYEPTAAEFLTFTWDGSEGAFKTQAEAKAAFLDVLKKVRSRYRVCTLLTLAVTSAHASAAHVATPCCIPVATA